MRSSSRHQQNWKLKFFIMETEEEIRRRWSVPEVIQSFLLLLLLPETDSHGGRYVSTIYCQNKGRRRIRELRKSWSPQRFVFNVENESTSKGKRWESEKVDTDSTTANTNTRKEIGSIHPKQFAYQQGFKKRTWHFGFLAGKNSLSCCVAFLLFGGFTFLEL